ARRERLLTAVPCPGSHEVDHDVCSEVVDGQRCQQRRPWCNRGRPQRGAPAPTLLPSPQTLTRQLALVQRPGQPWTRAKRRSALAVPTRERVRTAPPVRNARCASRPRRAREPIRPQRL